MNLNDVTDDQRFTNWKNFKEEKYKEYLEEGGKPLEFWNRYLVVIYESITKGINLPPKQETDRRMRFEYLSRRKGEVLRELYQ